MSTKIQDQWFSPGDKVMEVDVEAAMEQTVPGYADAEKVPTKPGAVYCVEKFTTFSPTGWNAVWLVGVDCEPDGLFAAEFRRVEEIRLCMSALRKEGKPLKTIPLANG